MSSSRWGFESPDRFELVREIGRGGMGCVFEAIDLERDVRVALKVLNRVEPRHVLYFKREFRALQDLQHENLVRLGELINQDHVWFYTMELVNGVDLITWVRRRRPQDDETGPGFDTLAPFDEQRLRDAFRQLAEAIAALHDAEKVHRDIKPSNVLVTPEGRVVLLDFGLITDADHGRQSSGDHVVGTPAYMAPEQAAANRVSTAADWYSLGTMLYECLTGRLPYEGEGLEVLMAKQRAEPPPPRTLGASIPEDLDRLTAQLLRFDPTERPLREHILRAFGARTAQLAFPSMVSLGADAFVGRGRELDQLEAAFAAASKGRGQAIAVHGESGIGKSALLEHFTARKEAEGVAVVLRGRCYERESIPYKAFDGVIDSLSRFLRKLSYNEVSELIPGHADLLTRMFPVLGRVEAIAHASATVRVRDAHEVRAVSVDLLCEMLRRIAKRHRIVIVIDDLQWADRESLQLLRELTRPPDPPPVLILMSSRSAEAVAELEPVTIGLQGLGRNDALELARRVAATSSAAAAPPEAVVEETRGHPMFIVELMRHSSAERGSLEVQLDDAIVQRAASVGDDARRVLELISLAAIPITEDQLSIAVVGEPGRVMREVALLRAARLARTAAGTTARGLETYHDRIREAVVSRLDARTARAHHERLAIALETTGADPAFLIAHFQAAGLDARAAEFAAKAAARAEENLAFERAVRLYGLALELGDHDAAARRRLYVALSDACANAGYSVKAANAALAAIDGADPTTRLQYRLRAVEQFLASGHISRGLELLDEVLAEMGTSMPSTPRRALMSVLWHRMRLRLRGIRWKEKHIKEIADAELTRVDVYKAVARGLAMVDNVRGADFQARGLLLALETGEPTRIAQLLGTEAVYNASQGGRGLRRGRALLGRLLAITEDSDAPELRAWGLTVDGAMDYFGGAFGRAAGKMAEAIELYRNGTGVVWELHNTRMFRLFALRHHGAFAAIDEMFEPLLRDASRRGDRYVETSLRLYGNLVLLARDDLEGARDGIERARWEPPPGRFHLQTWFDIEARGELALYHGDADSYFESTGERFAAFEGSLLTRIQIVRCVAKFLRARLAVAAGELRVAEKYGASLAKETISYADVMASMTRANVLAARGEEAARVAYSDVETLAEAAGMRFYAAASRRRRGELLGGDEGAELIRSADAALSADHVRDPGRFINLVAPKPVG